MRSAAGFLRPTRLKLLFLVEWALFVLIAWLQGSLGNTHQVLVALYPLGAFYLAACALAARSRRAQRIATGWRLAAAALTLLVLDQAAKMAVAARLALDASTPLVPGWLHLAHRRNEVGSWVLSSLAPQAASLVLWLQALAALVCLVGSLASYRYYLRTHRQSLWADVAFLGLFSGLLSWLVDVGLRGSIVDFLELPGLVTADLKDIWLTLGIAALFAEAVDNPQLSWRWRGWREEGKDLGRLARSLLRFSAAELSRAWEVVARWLGRADEGA